VFSPDGLIRYVNASVEQVLGYPREFIGGKNVLEYIHPEDLPRVAGGLRHRAQTPGVGTVMEFRIRHADGSWRTLEANAHNLLDEPAVQGLLVTGRDVTDRKELEEQLRQAQKMEAVGRLAGGVAHDFNNMLQVIAGFGAFLEGDVDAESEAMEYVHEIQKAADRAASLTRQLLAFGRRQVLQPKVLDLNKVVESASGMLRRLIPASISMETRLPPELVGVDVDPMQIQQVLMNLVVNARDAMPKGGTVTIETQNRTIRERHRRVLPFLKQGEYVALVVRDNGCGMSDDTLADLRAVLHDQGHGRRHRAGAVNGVRHREAVGGLRLG
jgi:two-component system cell cycle sensor histidine kinase/response regulator CckA